MQVRVLGPIEVIDNHRLAIGGPRQRRIMAALAMHAGEVVSVDRLADIAWAGEEPPASAPTNVRSYVNRIRDGLGDLADRLVTSAPGYVLDLADGELDATELVTAAAAADQAAARADLDAAIAHTDRAIDLWRGRPYAEFADEEWARAEVQRLDEVRLHALELRCDALIELGRPERALEELDVLVAEQPYRERLRRLQMLALYHCRREPEALRVFQEFRSILADEVGVSPSTELVELDRQIIEHDPALQRSESRSRHVRGYELHEVIGEGAFAMVWRGTQPVLDRDVAIKQIREQLANDPDFIRRFEVEARIVSALEHPFIVPLYDYWREPGAAFLVMRMLGGGTLETRLQDGPLSNDDLVRLVEQIGSALDIAHRNGVVHRDIKPGNILLDGEGNFFLTDFGIAFGIGDESDDAAAAALSTGSPAYAAPEQLRREALDARTDIYAFGITVYEASTGELPFKDERTRAGLVQRQLEDSVPAPSSVRPVPLWVDRLVAEATDKQRDQRVGSARELIEIAAPVATSAVDARAGNATVVAGETRNPFKGLRAFTEADSDDFRGRQRLVDRLVEAMRRPGSAGRLVAAVGPSGSGKSSVVRAGLLPSLRHGAIEGSADWFITTMVPGANPFEELESALIRIAAAPPGPLAELMRANDRGIARAVKQVIPEEHAELVIVIDQFEELFTLVADEDERRDFIDGLIAAVKEPRSRVRVVATIRADFWDRPLRYPNLAALLETAAVTVSPLSADELERVIVDPVAEQGMAYEPGLVARISAEVVDQPGALPLLQYTLTQLFERHVSGLLTSAAFDELGGVAGSVAQRAEEIYGDLDDTQRGAAQRLFGRLVTLGEGVEDTRRRVALAELGDDAANRQVIDAYGQARLLAFDRDPATSAPTVEVAHEALIREWPRLRAWLDDDRDELRLHRHLTLAATTWTEGDRDAGELYRGARLASAEVLVASDAVNLNDAEAEFLSISLARRDDEERAERHRVRRLRRLVTATAIVAVLTLIAGAAALWQWNRADDEAAQAEASAQEAADNAATAKQNAQQAEANASEADANAARADASAAEAEASAALAEERATEAEAAERQADIERLRAVALNTAEVSPATAALLAVEAHRLAPTTESLDVVQRVLTEIPGYDGTLAGGPYLDAVLVDDVTLAAASASSIDVWDLRDRAVTRSIDHLAPEGFADLSLGTDNAIAALDIGRSSTTVYDLRTGEVIAAIDHDDVVNDIAMSPDGQRLAVASASGRVAVWPITGGIAPTRLDTTTEDARFVRWHPTNDQIAVVTLSSGVQLWDIGTQELLWTTEAAEFGIINQITPFAASFSPSGDLIAYASGSLDGGLITLNAADGSPAFDRIGLTQLFGFVVDDLTWTDEQTVTMPSRRIQGRAVLYSAGVDRWIIAGSNGLEFWATDRSGPLRQTIVLPDEQLQSLAAGAGPVLQSLAADGSQLLVSVFDLPVPPSTYTIDLTSSLPTSTAAPGVGITIGYGEYTLSANNFLIQILDADLEPLGAPVPMPPDFSELGASDDGRYFALGRLGGKADVYRTTGEFLGTVELGPTEEFAGAQNAPWFTSDGEFMALSTTDGRAGLFRPETLERIALPDPYGSGWLMAMGPWLYAPTGDGSTQRLDPESLELVGEPISLHGFTALGYSRYDATQNRIAAFGPSSIKVIDVESGLQLGRDLPSGGGASRIEFTADGSILSVPLGDGSIDLWNFDTDAWADIACQYAGRNLTEEEWEQLGPRTIDYRPTCDQFPAGR
jgi:serine/threonine protein kinase/WD40 repeat protein